MPQPGMDPMVQQLFNPIANQPLNQPQVAPNPFMAKGSLVTFRYSFWVHDPVPLVIVNDFASGYRMRGINLHYLTFPYVRNLVSRLGSGGFSYQSIKGDAYISSSFRTYKWAGISQVKIFDSQFVLKMMAVSRTFDPYQIRAIRQSVEQQLQQQTLPKAEETVEQPYGNQGVQVQPQQQSNLG
jgi:hypothetical protein